LAVILGASAVTAGKAYRNHAEFVGVVNDDPERAVEWTLGERVWQFLTRARRVVTPKPAAKEQAAMAYYLYLQKAEEGPPQVFYWVLSDWVEEGPPISCVYYCEDALPTGTWNVDYEGAPAPTVTASGDGYLVSGAGTGDYNGQYNPNGATCNGEPVYELGYGPSPKWGWPWPEPGIAETGGWTWGEQFPESPEVPCPWTEWSDGAGGAVAVGGDANWGKLQLGTGEVAHSPVKDWTTTGWSGANFDSIGLCRYGDTPAGGMDVYWRESDTIFGQDDALPAWTQVTVTPETSPQLMPMTKRYRQIKLVGQ